MNVLPEKMIRWGGGLWIFLVALSCVPDNNFQWPDDKTYFPLQRGNYWIYQVQDTAISFNVSKASIYQVKMMVTDSFLSATGSYSYVINRYRRDSVNSAWNGLDTWSLRLADSQLIITEQNIPYVKLIFPVTLNKTWNGNEFNDVQTGNSCPPVYNTCDPYVYDMIKGAFKTSAGMSFDDVVEVVESNDVDIIEGIDIRKSKYANHIGLIFDERNIQVYCTSDKCPAPKYVETGSIVIMELIEYGHE